jgi:hypothetical protein
MKHYPSSESETPIRSTIDIAHANLFQSKWDQNAPTFPIMQELGAGTIHRVTPSIAPFEFPELLRMISSKLVRSDMRMRENGEKVWSTALFRTRGGAFVQWVEDTITVYAANQDCAVRIARRLQKMLFTRMERKFVPGYLLIKKIMCDVDSEFVKMETVKQLADDDLSLYYGDELLPWHQEFLEKFTTRNSGITIMEGPPGCGKTTYIRGLITSLARTHRFYFVPPHQVGILSEPEFIDFWSKERDKYRDRRLVLVIEDAEHALESRANDNRTLVSTLLNYSDGLLSDFLKMQIICTINCSSTKIDQALLRPGRLLARRVFGRLSRDEGARLAKTLGKTLGKDIDLQVDYSLAEIFNDAVDEAEGTDRIVGFAA